MKDTTRPYNPMELITKNPEWIAVETIIKDQIASLSNVTDINTDLPADELKIELKARKIAADKLEEFYKEYKFTTVQIEENNVSFK